MKYKVLIPAIILGGLIGFFSFRYIDSKVLNPPSKSTNQQQVILKTVMGIIEQGHYAAKDIDDSFSAQVFNKMFETLDMEKKFFLQSDVEKLQKYKYSIDDQIYNEDLSFYNEVMDIFRTRIQESQKYYQKHLNSTFDFTNTDIIETDPEKIQRVNSTEAMEARWHQLMKYRVLAKYYDLTKEQEKKIKDSANFKPKSVNDLKTEAISSVLKSQDRYFKRLNKFNENDFFAFYMNTLTGVEDPHTTFMQPTDKKRFDEMMSGSFIGIGATLQQMDDGRIKITSIVTGSPSWKQGQLKVDDIIEKIAQADDAPVDVEGYELEDAIKMIRGKEGTVVKLTVAKTDGSRIVIPITRGKVDLENVLAKSTIINHNNQKIGYIVLPEFYSNFNGYGNKSSDDIEKELKKLQAENVSSVILDLRNNGGGSLQDVVDIVGLFVGTGPVVQIRTSGDNVTTLKSRRSEALYKGPLVVMINNGSASASEILAAAIQDYNRGIVVGSKSFGKGTVQKIVPLDQFVSPTDRKMILDQYVLNNGGNAEYDGIGSLKLTIQKFYRINGGSTQIKGVEPDIALPDAFELLEEIGEKKDKNALPWDKIPASQYKTYEPINFNTLRINSKNRIAKDESFNFIKQTAQRIKNRKDESVMPLNEVKFTAKMKENEALAKRIEELDSLKVGLNVENLKVDLPQTTIDEAAKENNNKWLKALRRDPFLLETSNILIDYIKMKK